MKRYPDLPADIDHLDHFMQTGSMEGREPSEYFSVNAYNNYNPDIKFSPANPFTHFIFNGILENRKYEQKLSDMDVLNSYRQLAVSPVLYDKDHSESLPYSAKKTIAVHLHLCYTDMAEYFVKYFRMIPQKFDLYISLPMSDQTQYFEEFFRDRLPNVDKVEVVKTVNRGRDIAPFVVTFGKKLMQYDWICHVHTKRSPHAGKLSGWLDYIMEHLFGSSRQLEYIFSLLEQNVRMIFPPAYKHLDYDETGWGRNFVLFREALEKYPALNIKWFPTFIEFSHGSMLWARGSAMKGFLDLPFTYDDFPEEPIDSDATLAHILERLTLLQTVGCGDKANMFFLKDDLDDYVRYNMMQEKLQQFESMFAGNGENDQKLVFVSHDSDKSGGPILALHIAETLRKMKYKLYIIILKKGELFGEFEKQGTVQVFDPDNMDKLKNTIPVLRKAGFHNVLFNTVLSGSLAPMFKQEKFNTVSLIHEMGFSIEHYQWQNHARQVIDGSDKIVFPSRVVADSWKEAKLEVPEEKQLINPQGDYWKKNKSRLWKKEEVRKEVCEDLLLPEDCRIVLAAALVEKRKGVEAFVETAEKFAAKDPDVYFVWIGSTPDRLGALPELAEKIDRLPNCIFTGFRKELDKYMAAADIFFLPSLADPFPAVSLLATSQATPVVLCEGYTGSADFCRNFDAGMVKEYSTEAFVSEIEKLLYDEKLHEKVSQQSLDFSRNFHSMRQYLIELLSLYPGGLKKVSCIVPNYQYEKYLPERLNSVLSQDYPIYDIVFLDDCSRDKSLEVAEKILSEGGIDYTVLPNTVNSGCVFRQWFKGIEAAKGDFIWIAEADDACSPEFLQKTVPAFSDPDVNLSYAQSCLMDGTGKVYNSNFKSHTDNISRSKWLQRYIAPFDLEINDGLAIKNTIPNASAILIRKSACGKINKEFLFEFKVAGDWVFYVELLKGGKVAFTPEILNYYRRHNVSVVNKNLTRNLQEIEKIHAYLLKNFVLNNSTILAMKEEYYVNYNGLPSEGFTPTLKYEDFLRNEGGKLCMFVTDDLKKNRFVLPGFLKRYAEKNEVRLIYAGDAVIDYDFLAEVLPENVAFRRLEDLMAEKQQNRESGVVVVTELSSGKSRDIIKQLGFLISGNDAIMVYDSKSMAALKQPLLKELDKFLSGSFEGVSRKKVTTYSLWE